MAQANTGNAPANKLPKAIEQTTQVQQPETNASDFRPPLSLQAETIVLEPELSSNVVILYDTTLMYGLNTVRLSIQVPVKVKTQDGEMTTFSEVTLIPGLQIKPRYEWNQLQSSSNKLLKEALERGAIREAMPSLNHFNSLQPYEAFDLIKKCIDESSVKLLQYWLSGTLATRNRAVADAVATQITELTGTDAFAQARKMMPSSAGI